jgi:hypothetical protein
VKCSLLAKIQGFPEPIRDACGNKEQNHAFFIGNFQCAKIDNTYKKKHNLQALQKKAIDV